MVETALYYGFSTIAQCIAAAIALLGAFGLFRMQTLFAAMRVPARTLVSEHHLDHAGSVELDELFLAEDFAAIEAAFSSGRFKAVADQHPHAGNARATLGRLLATRQRLQEDLGRALAWTAVVIIGSVAMIFLVPLYAHITWLVVTVATLGTLALAGCLRLYAGIVAKVRSQQGL